SCGCPACRPAWRARLKDELAGARGALCPDCLRRYERNVFRILDCKNPSCRAVAAKLPGILDHLCGGCRDHFDAVKRSLSRVGASSAVDPLLVRGLDYYTRTVFEVTSDKLGAQDAVAAGGRYDGLVSELGGPDTPAVGFAMGMERAILLMSDGESPAPPPDLYVATTDRDLHEAAWVIATEFRRAGLSCEIDYENRSLKAQMREANRLNVPSVAIIGPDEMKAGVVTLRDMATKKERKLSVEDALLAIRDEKA
ncbi:MAG: His/Gly/Thr/Pro-type tRNA ligase C-terminal domain-containing protein, partial [Planctomycetota bacterium]